MKVRAWRLWLGSLVGLGPPCLRPLLATPRVGPEGEVFAASALMLLQHPISYPLTSPALPRGAQRGGAAQHCKGWKWTPLPTLEGALFLANATMNKIALGMTRRPGGAGSLWAVCGHPEEWVWGWSLILKACSATPTACRLQNLGARQRCYNPFPLFLGRSRSPFTLE